MKKWIMVLIAGLFLVASSILAVGVGDKNQGETGTGTTVLGTAAQGLADQPRVGR